MSTCNRCGKLVEFRYVGGRCIPLHSGGGCYDTKSNSITDYSGTQYSKDSTCYSTSCPKCQSEVYFVQHNGGSVWIDAPLGPPWYKHDCMIDIKKTRSENSQVSILVLYDHKLESLSDSVFLGVVVKCCVSNDKSQTELSLDIGSKKPIKLMCKNNGGFLLGKLCVVDTDFKYIFPLEEKELKYALIGNIHPQVLTNRNKRILKRESPFDTKNCPECGVLVFSSKLQNHIQDKHRDKS